MKILNISPTFYPAFYWGGPIYSTYGLCSELHRMPGMILRVLTSDSSGPRRNDRLPYSCFPATLPSGFKVWYCRKWFGKEFAPSLLVRLYWMVRWADVVHLTGVYSIPTIPTLILCALLDRPVIWSPRGALQRWEGTSRSRLKVVWEFVCRCLVSRDRVILHVTSAEEAQDSLARIPEAAVAVISNGVDMPVLPVTRGWIPDGVLRLLYIGRLHPKKGLKNLFAALSLLDSYRVTLRVCGAGDDDYTAALMADVARLGLEDRVSFSGQVDGLAKSEAFFAADLCVVPSHTENFGMVVAESLAHAVPVIVSKGTPWADVEKYGCGVWVENAPESLATAICNMRTMDLAEMGFRGREWMQKEFGWDKVANDMLAVYAGVVGDRKHV